MHEVGNVGGLYIVLSICPFCVIHIFHLTLKSTKRYEEELNVTVAKDKCSNRYIKNVLKRNYLPFSTVFWSFKCGIIQWKKVWSITNKFF